MAIISQCLYCGKEVLHSASSMPLCEDHDGKRERKNLERDRWNRLTIEQKLDELKEMLDEHLANPPFDSNTLIG